MKNLKLLSCDNTYCTRLLDWFEGRGEDLLGYFSGAVIVAIGAYYLYQWMF
ncbi:MAG: hypothetical protein PF440_01230 [Thiomicrorhabdus sp.]|jgi:hypothetical protein|nr:hypothetical protein [Thiomicrorhabdus sp.]